MKLIVEYVSVDGKSHVYSALHTLSPRRLVNIRHKVIHIPNDRIVKFEIQSLNVEPLKLDQISLVSKTGEEISPVLPVGQSVSVQAGYR